LLSALPRTAAIKRGLNALDEQDQLRRFQNVFSILPGAAIDGLFHGDLLPPNAGDTILDCWSELKEPLDGTDELGAFQFLEIRSSLPDELLIYGDKLSMAHSLEVRVPYLDREVVEYAQRLTASLKVNFGRRKHIHRAICAEFLPREVIRRKKRGFAANVVDDWFRRSVSRHMDAMLLDRNSQMYSFLKPTAVAALLREHRSGASDHHKILFSLVVFELWLRSARNARHVTTLAS